jgi:hypothetical protein
VNFAFHARSKHAQQQQRQGHTHTTTPHQRQNTTHPIQGLQGTPCRCMLPAFKEPSERVCSIAFSFAAHTHNGGMGGVLIKTLSRCWGKTGLFVMMVLFSSMNVLQ